MKTITFTMSILFILSIFFISPSLTHAQQDCMELDVVHITIDEIFAGDHSMLIVSPVDDGFLVDTEIIDVQVGNVSANISLQVVEGLCGGRQEALSQNEFVLILKSGEVSSDMVFSYAPNNDSNYFMWSFNSLGEAKLKVVDLFEQKLSLIENPTDDTVQTDPQPADVSIPTNSGYSPAGQTLRPGDKNDNVEELQSALNEVLGLNLIIDGSYGNVTKLAVKQFQELEGLVVDGFAGALTQTALSKSNVLDQTDATPATTPSLSSQTLRPGMKGEEVSALQVALNKVSGISIDIDGSYGPVTSEAVRKFQELKNLSQDGIAGPITKDALDIQDFEPFDPTDNGSAGDVGSAPESIDPPEDCPLTLVDGVAMHVCPDEN